MSKTVTLTLPEDLEAALNDATRQEGLPASQVVTDAIKEYLFFRRLRLLRDTVTRARRRLWGSGPISTYLITSHEDRA